VAEDEKVQQKLMEFVYEAQLVRLESSLDGRGNDDMEKIKIKSVRHEFSPQLLFRSPFLLTFISLNSSRN
jgi:hypothetical protein